MSDNCLSCNLDFGKDLSFLRQFAPNKVNIADMKLFGVERYLRQIYWNNGSSVDDPYRRCLRLYLNVSHTEG